MPLRNVLIVRVSLVGQSSTMAYSELSLGPTQQ